jgi:hypothetical protein
MLKSKLKVPFSIMRYKELDILGSANDSKLDYFSDIDTQEFIQTSKTYRQILEFFQDKYTKAIKDKNIWVTDFKAGHYAGRPLKWSYVQLMNGYQWIDDKRFSFIGTLTQQSIIKMDIIVILDGEFIELSTNYTFNFTGKNQTFPCKDNIADSLLYDYRILKKTNFYKSLKRLYAYYKFIDDKDSQKVLLKIFNSKLGFLNKQLNSLKTIVLLIDNKYRPKKEDIITAISKINVNLQKYNYNVDLDNIESKSVVKIKQYLNDVIIILSEILDDDVNTFIKKSNISYVLK